MHFFIFFIIIIIIFFFIFHLFCFCVQCLLVGTFQQQTCSVLCRFIYFLFIYFGITSFVPCKFVQLIEKKKKKKKKKKKFIKISSNCYAWFSLGAERAKRARIRALEPLAPSVNTITKIQYLFSALSA